MRLWRSVVGKLWMTILFLVSFVLLILTILLLQFFEKYHVNQIEQGLSDQAEKIIKKSSNPIWMMGLVKESPLKSWRRRS